MTDSLRFMRNLESIVFCNVTSFGGMKCNGTPFGTLTLVFVTGDDEFVVNRKGVLYSLNLWYNIFAPNVEFDGVTWDRIGGLRRVMSAFGENVTFSNHEGMLGATACQLARQLA